MTAESLSAPEVATRDRLGVWCGLVMVGAALLIPPIVWLSPEGFAPLVALMGLLCLPAIRMTDEDRPGLMVLLGALVWAAAASAWAIYKPKHVESGPLVQLALGLPLFWAAVCGARRADPRLNMLGLAVLRWGLSGVAVLLLLDVALHGEFYRGLHERYYEPIRIDLAQVNLAHSCYVLGVLWPAVFVAGLERRWETALTVLVVTATVVTAHAFGGDAPVLAAPIAAATILFVWRWPRLGPRWIAVKVALVGFAMPALIWALRASGQYAFAERIAPASWAVRLSYWSHAIDWIAAQPIRGWGLESARMMGPGIELHPHNGALQVWLDLGLVGALAAAAFWGLSFWRLTRARPDLAAASVAGAAAAYVFFAWMNFGMWQGWWLALGALVPVLAGMLTNRQVKPKSTATPISG